MNKKNIFIIVLMLAALFLISCGKKKAAQEEEVTETQEILPSSSETQNEKEPKNNQGIFDKIQNLHNKSDNQKVKEEKESEKAQKTYDKAYNKAQKTYDEKGIEKFIEYVEKENYLPVKDSSQDDATPLLIAVKDGDLEKAKLFLEKGASVEEKDSKENGLLDYALQSSNSESLAFAIEALPIPSWNVADANGCFPFIKAIVQRSDFTVIQKCIDLTNDINCADKNGKMPLMYAAQSNVDVRTVKYLLDKGAKIDTKNSNEWSALMYAARYNPNPAVMEDLILRGANSEPNSVGLTVTMLAACNPNPGVLMTLLKYKDEINAATDKGKTALMYACENGQNSSVIKMLIDNGANLNAKDSNGKTIREYLSANPSLSTSDIAIAWKSAEETGNTESAEIDLSDEETVSEEE